MAGGSTRKKAKRKAGAHIAAVTHRDGGVGAQQQRLSGAPQRLRVASLRRRGGKAHRVRAETVDMRGFAQTAVGARRAPPRAPRGGTRPRRSVAQHARGTRCSEQRRAATESERRRPAAPPAAGPSKLTRPKARAARPRCARARARRGQLPPARRRTHLVRQRARQLRVLRGSRTAHPHGVLQRPAEARGRRAGHGCGRRRCSGPLTGGSGQAVRRAWTPLAAARGDVGGSSRDPPLYEGVKGCTAVTCELRASPVGERSRAGAAPQRRHSAAQRSIRRAAAARRRA